MKITFLGTGSGAPSRQRNVSATALIPDAGKHWVLVDCGEATQHQLLRTGLSPQKLAAILITHIHGDHCYGLPGLLASCQLNGRTEPLTLIAPSAVWEYLQAVIRFTELQINYPLTFIEVHEALEQQCAGFHITAWPLNHRVPSWGYRFEEAEIPRRLNVGKLRAEGVKSGPVYGQLQQGHDVQLSADRYLRSADYTEQARVPRVVVIGGDNDTPEMLTEACRQAHVLVHEATYTEDVLARVGTAPQHSCARQVATFAEQIALPTLILTHFSPRYLNRALKPKDRSVTEIETEARHHYSGELYMAGDLVTYTIDYQGGLVKQPPIDKK